MKRILLALMLLGSLLWTLPAFAVPTVEQVQTAVKAGNYTEAETMMGEVVTAKPNSAKAHYIYAEILAHNAKFDLASQQVTLASQIDPSASFTTPEKFRSFQQLLQREQARPPARSQVNTAPVNEAPVTPANYGQQRSGGIPGWVWLVGIVALIVIVFKMFSRSAGMRTMASGPGPGPGPGYTAGYPGGGYGPQGGPMMGGGGSGLLGTGLAAAGGVAAGMFAEKMLEEHRDGFGRGDGGNYVNQGGGYDNSGSNDAAQQLESRDVDFGSGGDWGGDAGGGGIDTGSSGGSDGW